MELATKIKQVLHEKLMLENTLEDYIFEKMPESIKVTQEYVDSLNEMIEAHSSLEEIDGEYPITVEHVLEDASIENMIIDINKKIIKVDFTLSFNDFFEGDYFEVGVEIKLEDFVEYAKQNGSFRFLPCFDDMD